jgi:glycosyltransferase involved in cell wall biosynthesis
MPPAIVSVVIATRDRPSSLARCLDALTRQRTDVPFEIVVVDDGSAPPIAYEAPGPRPDLRVLRLTGVGPARARNLGWQHASGQIIAFTDDDTLPGPEWVDAAGSLATARPNVVFIEGPTETRPFDPLREHSVKASGPGAFLTCNIGYRRSALERAQGFFERFPSAHCEDIDLGLRIGATGDGMFDPRMTVEHMVRETPLLRELRDGRIVTSELVLFSRHPVRFEDELAKGPVRFAVESRLRRWVSILRARKGEVLRSPHSLLRWGVIVVGQTATAAWAAWKFSRSPHDDLETRVT